MKKIIFSMLLIAAPVTGFAQLKVNADGSVLAGTNNLGSYFIQLGSSSTKTTGYNIGVAGKSAITGYSGISCGVWGHAQNLNISRM